MGTLISEDPAPVNTAARQAGYGGLSTGYGLWAAVEQAWYDNPASALARGATLQDAELGQQISRWGGHREPASPLLDPAVANERYGIPGEITFKAPVREQAARLTHEWAIERRRFADQLSRAQSGILPTTSRFAVQLLASAADPVNLASAFIPVVGEARFAALAGRFGKPIARVITGAVEGAVGSALVEPIIYSQAQREQADYDAYDSLLNLSLGAGIGAIAHPLIGAITDRFTRQPTPQPKPGPTPAQHQAALAGAVAAVADDRPVRVGSLLDAVDRIQKAAAERPTPVQEGATPKPAEPAPPKSATEQAMADSAQITPGMVDKLHPGPVASEANREFLRAFIGMLPQSEQGALLDPRGQISQQGIARVKAALLAKAYGDADLVGRLAESTDDNMRTIGRALADVAPLWIKLRDLAAAGRIPAEMDATKALMQALALVQRARDQKLKVGDLARQVDMFDPEAEKLQLFLQFMYGPRLSRAIGYEKLVATLSDYAEQAMLNVTGPRLMGDTLTAKEIMQTAGRGETVDPKEAWAAAVEDQRKSAEIQPDQQAAINQATALAKDEKLPETIENAKKEAEALDLETQAAIEAARAGGLLTAADEAALTAGGEEAADAIKRAKGIEAFGACLTGEA